MNIGDKIAPRDAFGNALAELGGLNPNIVVFDTDVCESTKTNVFRNKFPDRFFEMGIAEANMVGAAAGMATIGWAPWVSTFAVFLAKRAVDQIRVMVAYANQNVKINGAYGGIPTGNAGATHQSVQDIGVMRAMPNMKVVSTADAVETRLAVLAAGEYTGPLYLRTVRDPVPVIFGSDYKFEIGPAYTLREGTAVTIISEGMMTAKALQAAAELDKEGLSVRVIHMPTIKPIDVETIVKASRETGRIVTVENHSILSGLGGAVAEVLTEHAPCYQKRLGFPDTFGESGPTDAIFSKFGMNTEHIMEAARQMVAKESALA